MDEQLSTQRVAFLMNEWGGEPLTESDLEILLDALPAIGQEFAHVAPRNFPDGTETGAVEILQHMAAAASRAAENARGEADFLTLWRLTMLMRYVRQPQNVPASSSWLDLVSESRRTLQARKDEAGLKGVNNAAQLNLTWWRQNGQWARFEQALAEARSPEDVANIAIMPPEPPEIRMTVCTDCGQPVSTRARTCPTCGAPGPSIDVTQERKPKSQGLRNALLVALLVLGLTTVALTITFRPSSDPATTQDPASSDQQEPLAPNESASSAESVLDRYPGLESACEGFVTATIRARAQNSATGKDDPIAFDNYETVPAELDRLYRRIGNSRSLYGGAVDKAFDYCADSGGIEGWMVEQYTWMLDNAGTTSCRKYLLEPFELALPEKPDEFPEFKPSPGLKFRTCFEKQWYRYSQ